MATIKIVRKSDPIKGDAGSAYKKPMIERSMDIRDRLSELIGKGSAMKPDDRNAVFADLSDMVGIDKARKIMDHAAVFNQRTDIQKLPLEDKLNAFYTIGSSDPDVNSIMSKSKSLGYGVLPGFRNSISQINQELAGRLLPSSMPLNQNAANKVILKTRNF